MGGGVGWYAKSFSCPTQLEVMLGFVELLLSLGFDNKKNNINNINSLLAYYLFNCLLTYLHSCLLFTCLLVCMLTYSLTSLLAY